MLKGKTSSGFEFSLDENVLNNMELVDALAEAENDNPVAISKACVLLLGKETRKKLYDHIREPDGRVQIEKVSQNLADIFEALGNPAKN